MKIYVMLSLIVLILISGCGEQSLTNTQNTQSPEISEQVKLATKEPSEMILTERDFPSEWKLLSRGEKTKSNIFQEGLDLGWIKGYGIRYGKGENIFDPGFSIINQAISVYPTENIDKVIDSYNSKNIYKILRNSDSNDEFIIEGISNPNLGDKSVAFKIIDEYGNSISIIVFNKMNIHVILYMGGSVDSELLKDMAKKAEKKIK